MASLEPRASLTYLRTSENEHCSRRENTHGEVPLPITTDDNLSYELERRQRLAAREGEPAPPRSERMLALTAHFDRQSLQERASQMALEEYQNQLRAMEEFQTQLRAMERRVAAGVEAVEPAPAPAPAPSEKAPLVEGKNGEGAVKRRKKRRTGSEAQHELRQRCLGRLNARDAQVPCRHCGLKHS